MGRVPGGMSTQFLLLSSVYPLSCLPDASENPHYYVVDLVFDYQKKVVIYSKISMIERMYCRIVFVLVVLEELEDSFEPQQNSSYVELYHQTTVLEFAVV